MISIVTASYNCATFIDRAYQSLCKQNWADFEWIVVDDKSSDNSVEVLTEIARNAPFKMRVFALPVNSGGSIAMSYGLHAARGELMFFLDHDDEMMPDVLNMIQGDWNKYGPERKYSGLIYRTLNPVTRQPNSAPFGFGPLTLLQVRNVKKAGYDELCVFDREIITRIFTYELADKMCWFGAVYDKVTKIHPLLYCRDDVVKIYHRDIQQSQTNSVTLSRQMVFVYGEEFNDIDSTWLHRPVLYVKILFNLLRFSDSVHGSPIFGIKLIHSALIRAVGYAMLPFYWVAKSWLRKYPVRHRDTYPFAVLDRDIEVRPARVDPEGA